MFRAQRTQAHGEPAIGRRQSPNCWLRFSKNEAGKRSKIGDREKTQESFSVMEHPKCSADFPEAAVREGADELTRRRGEERTVNNTSVAIVAQAISIRKCR